MFKVMFLSLSRCRLRSHTWADCFPY